MAKEMNLTSRLLSRTGSHYRTREILIHVIMRGEGWGTKPQQKSNKDQSQIITTIPNSITHP